MSLDEIKNGCDIPVRFITCSQEGVTKRSDVFNTDKWLRELEKYFCKDLLKDTNETLIWLETFNNKQQNKPKPQFKPFTFDFDSLYNSLSPNLVLIAIKQAMDECRPMWTNDLKKWICELVKLSKESAVGKYKPKGGLSIGGSMSVQLANITVYFVLQN